MAVLVSKKILCEGTWGEKGTYRIKFNTKNVSDMVAKIFDGKNKYEVKSSEIVWDNIDIKNENLHTLASQFNNRFEVIIKHDNHTSSYRVHIKSKSPKASIDLNQIAEPSELTFRRQIKNRLYNILSLENANDLKHANAQENQDTILSTIQARMVDIFCAPSFELTGKPIQEMLEIAESLSIEERKRVIEKLIKGVHHSIILKKPMLDGLTGLLNQFQRINYKNALSDAIKNTSKDPIERLAENPLNTLEANDFVQLMDTIATECDNVHASPDALLMYLKALIALLDAMMIVGVTDLNRKKHHDKFSKIIARYKDHEDIRIAYLSSYGDQSFTIVKNDESKTHSFVRRSMHVLKGLMIIGSKISYQEPWKILEAVDSYTEFKKAFANLHGWKKDWFTQLLIFQELFLGWVPEKLKDFEIAIKKEDADIKKALSMSHDPIFVQGLVILMQQIFETYANERPEIGRVVLSILEKIANDNKMLPKKAQKPLFKTKKKYSTQIENEISELIIQYKKRLDTPVAKKDEFPKEPRTSIFAVTDSNTQIETLFIKAVKEVAPWMPVICCFKESLENDPQVTEEWDYAIALKGKDSKDDSKGELMEVKINRELNDEENKVVVILGNSGTGKSLFSKLFVLDSLDTFNSEKPLDLFISLSTLKNPVNNLMEEILGKLNLQNQKEHLQKRKLRVFLDGFDEMYIGGRRPDGGLDNLYQSNDLSNLWPHLQLVITCRWDFLRPEDTIYFMTQTGKKKILLVTPFEKEDIKKLYLPKYIKVRQKRDPFRTAPPTLWTDPKKYIKYIKDLDLWGTISTPFYLKVMADTLPEIVEKYENEVKRKKEQGEININLLKVTKEDLFDTYLCQRFREEFLRQLGQGSPIKDMTEYLNFALELSHNMQICGKRSISLKDESLLVSNQKAFINEQRQKIAMIKETENSKEKSFFSALEEMNKNSSLTKQVKSSETMQKRRTEEKAQAEADIQAIEKHIEIAENAVKNLLTQLFGNSNRETSLRRASFLVKKEDGRVEFLHPSIYEHFRAIDDIVDDRNRILKRLDEMKLKMQEGLELIV